MAIARTDDMQTVGRGGWPSIGPKLGLVQAELNLETLVSANDYVAAFSLPAGTLVLGVGLEVVTPSTNSVTVSFGLDGSGAGSRTEFSGELAVNGAAGTKLAAGYEKANVILSAADIMVAEISGDPGNAAVIRAWAIIADINDME